METEKVVRKDSRGCLYGANDQEKKTLVHAPNQSLQEEQNHAPVSESTISHSTLATRPSNSIVGGGPFTYTHKRSKITGMKYYHGT